jgi:uncharacterized membrane protein YecN with MAPEG domain
MVLIVACRDTGCPQTQATNLAPLANMLCENNRNTIIYKSICNIFNLMGYIPQYTAQSRKILSLSQTQYMSFGDTGYMFRFNKLIHNQALYKIDSKYRTMKCQLNYMCSCIAHVAHYYLLTPWSRVLLQKLTRFAASQEIPHIYGTRNFITVLTSARHLSLSSVRPIQSPQPSPTSWRSILILSYLLRLGPPNGLLPSGFLTKTLCTPLPSPCSPHGQPISFFLILPPAPYGVRSTDH